MGISKKPSAGGVARWAQANLSRHRSTGSPEALERAKELLQWLLAHPGKAAEGKGWGVPFVWQTYFGTVPADTAVAHTTQSAGHAFLDLHDLTGEPWALEAAHDCAHFLTTCLNPTERPDGSVALSYTPLDHSQVINTCAEVAGFLHRCARPVDQPFAQKIAAFVCATQSEDGSWPYSAPDSVTGPNPVDHYHTGMVLSGLQELLGDPKCLTAAETGLAFHLDRHFESNGCPRMRPTALLPIDSYSAGESLVVLTSYAKEPRISPELRHRCSETLYRLADYTVKHLGDGKGRFIYRRYAKRTMWLDSLRWSQAILSQGLTEYAASGLD